MLRWIGALCVLGSMLSGFIGEPLGAESAGRAPLQALADAVGPGQGVYAVADDGTVLVARQADYAVHPASVTKVATTITLLERFGPVHRFETRVSATGGLRGGTLEGNLVVESSGDPFFVDEGALQLLDRLRSSGVRVVAGRLIVRGPLLFDWQPDRSGRSLEAVLRGEAGAPARATLAGERNGRRYDTTPLVFRHGKMPTSAHAEALALYRSPPLVRVVKSLNCYSNNVFHLAADALGGAHVVEEHARAHLAPELRAEVVIDNAAGAGTTNRMSPRAAVGLLRALAIDLARAGMDLTATLPVSGIDPGTLAERLPEQPGIVVGKTGTFGSVGASALVGALVTARHGVVYFAVLNHGLAVPDARARQDAFVRALATATDARPWAYATAMTSPYLEAELR